MPWRGPSNGSLVGRSRVTLLRQSPQLCCEPLVLLLGTLQKLREAVPGYVNTWHSCRSTYSGSITPPHCPPHSSILFLGKDSISGVSCSWSASSFEGRIQPWEILKKDQLFSQQPLASCVGLGLLDWEQLIQSLLTNL